MCSSARTGTRHVVKLGATLRAQLARAQPLIPLSSRPNFYLPVVAATPQPSELAAMISFIDEFYELTDVLCWGAAEGEQ